MGEPTRSDAPPPPGAQMFLNSPLAPALLDDLVGRATAHSPGTILDIGCGWGEVLVRLLEAAPAADGTGVDLSAPNISGAGRLAATRGVADRAKFLAADAAAVATDPADLVVCLGSYQAFGGAAAAAAALRERTAPAGRALVGIEFWSSRPSDAQLAAMWEGTTREETLDLPTLFDVVTAAGWRALHLHESTMAEWDDFEFAHTAAREAWLTAHPEAPGAGALREELDAAHRRYLTGHRGVLGFATMLLAPQ